MKICLYENNFTSFKEKLKTHKSECIKSTAYINDEYKVQYKKTWKNKHHKNMIVIYNFLNKAFKRFNKL